MIPLFTELLRDYLVRRLVAPKSRIFLGPPNREFVTALPAGVSLNLYLVDIRHNRKLGTNERFRTRIETAGQSNGKLREDPYPAWVDAHYLISAWDKSVDTSAATLSEQAALRDVSASLLTGDPFTPGDIYSSPEAAELAALLAAFHRPNAASLQRMFDTALTSWPLEFHRPGLPYEVLPPSGFPNLSDFWTTMGQGSPWKPVVYLIASVPILLAQGQEFFEVTTMYTRTGQTLDAVSSRLVPETEHMWHQIGGRVLRFDGPPAAFVPLARARVILQAPGRNPDGTDGEMVPVQEVWSGDDGRYQFLFAGETPTNRFAPFSTKYQLIARYHGLQQGQPLDVDLNPTTPLAHDIVLRPAN